MLPSALPDAPTEPATETLPAVLNASAFPEPVIVFEVVEPSVMFPLAPLPVDDKAVFAPSTTFPLYVCVPVVVTEAQFIFVCPATPTEVTETFPPKVTLPVPVSETAAAESVLEKLTS